MLVHFWMRGGQIRTIPQEPDSNNFAREGSSDEDGWDETYSSHSKQYHHEPNNPNTLSGVQPAVSNGAPEEQCNGR